jgi:hypothetical protein
MDEWIDNYLTPQNRNQHPVLRGHNAQSFFRAPNTTTTKQIKPPFPTHTHRIGCFLAPSQRRRENKKRCCVMRKGGAMPRIFFDLALWNGKFSLFFCYSKHLLQRGLLPLKRNRRALSTHHFKAPQLEQTKSLTPAVSFPQTQHDLALHTQSFVEFHMAEPCKIGLSNRILFRDRSSSKKSCRHWWANEAQTDRETNGYRDGGKSVFAVLCRCHQLSRTAPRANTRRRAIDWKEMNQALFN